MKSSEQFIIKHGLEKTPMVDHLVFAFLKAIGLSPNFSKSIIRLTYDIDLMFRFNRFPPFRSTFKYFYKYPLSVIKDWKNYFKTKLQVINDPYFNFDFLLKKRKNIEQIIYFLVGGSSKYDKPLPRIDENFKKFILRAKNEDISIGIHPSYDTYNNSEIMLKEKEALENLTSENIQKSRQHFLHFSFKHTPDVLETVNIIEDSTIGYSDRIGFRSGTGFPYRLYNFKNEKPWKFIEVPFVCMDLALIREAKYYNKEILDVFNELIHSNENITQLTFNFHNSQFYDASMQGILLIEVYNKILSQHEE